MTVTDWMTARSLILAAVSLLSPSSAAILGTLMSQNFTAVLVRLVSRKITASLSTESFRMATTGWMIAKSLRAVTEMIPMAVAVVEVVMNPSFAATLETMMSRNSAGIQMT